jgi:hypothetical protein
MVYEHSINNMETKIEVCCFGEECSALAKYTCRCVEPCIFSCETCISTHLTVNSVHVIQHLIQNLDTLPIPKVDKSRDNNKLTLSGLQNSIIKINSCIQNITELKQKILILIEKRSHSTVAYLDILPKKSNSSLNSIKTSLKTYLDPAQDPTKPSSTLFYLQDLAHSSSDISNFPSELSISSPDLLTFSSNLNTFPSDLLSTSPSSHPSQSFPSYLYIPSTNSYSLTRLDTASFSTQKLQLSPPPSSKFKLSSSCMLEDGSVIIAGGYPTHGDTYKYIPNSHTCYKLGNLHTPRYYLHLCYHNNYIYAFGGSDGSYSNKAERLKFQGDHWETLPNMKEARCLLGSYCDKNRIYIFGGGYRRSYVERFDVENMKFEHVNSVIVDSGACLVGSIEDRIYVINKDVIVVSRDMQVLKEEKNANQSLMWNLSDVIVQGECFVFYCRYNEKVFMYNTRSLHQNMLSISINYDINS